MDRIVTLIENGEGEHHALAAEHGISFFIEKGGRRLLFDTGQSGAFIANSEKLKIDLSGTECVVISHGHYDHSGGIRPLSGLTTGFQLVVGKGFFTPKFATDGTSYEYLGNDFDEDFLRSRNIRYRFVEGGKEEIVPGVFAVTAFERRHSDEVTNRRFVRRRDGRFEPDPFDDEILLVVETSKGLVVVLGCSHPGLKNMLDTVRSLFPQPLYALLGGTHLVEASDESVERTLAYLTGVSEINCSEARKATAGAGLVQIGL